MVYCLRWGVVGTDDAGPGWYGLMSLEDGVLSLKTQAEQMFLKFTSSYAGKQV
jgi:hypothetical protein